MSSVEDFVGGTNGDSSLRREHDVPPFHEHDNPDDFEVALWTSMAQGCVLDCLRRSEIAGPVHPISWARWALLHGEHRAGDKSIWLRQCLSHIEADDSPRRLQ